MQQAFMVLKGQYVAQTNNKPVALNMILNRIVIIMKTFTFYI